MGYLANDTNNIILDAVLTDTGRQFLSRNDGSFSIVKWAASDDEVNYAVITKYGRTVGSEKIEKNTPVFEALTNATQAQKYRLISVSNPNLLRLPAMSLSGDANVNSLNNVVNLGATTQKTAAVTVQQTINNETSIDVELRDQTFVIDVNNIFLQVLSNVPENIDGQQRATYLLSRSPAENSFGGSIVNFTLSVKSLNSATFQVYGTTQNKQVINTVVRVSGLQSGAVQEFTVQITQGN